jgi:hypothetical protein
VQNKKGFGKKVAKTRKNAGKKENPTYALIDSQSVKTVSASESRGFDGGKNERKKTTYSYRYKRGFALRHGSQSQRTQHKNSHYIFLNEKCNDYKTRIYTSYSL